MKKILIIKLSSLGDVFMALPHMDAILAHHADDIVHLLTTQPYVDLFSHHPRLKTVVLDRSRWFAPESVRGRCRWIRREAFDTVYDLQGNRVSRRLVRASRATRRVGKEGGSVYNCYPPSDDESRHVFDRLSDFVGSAGVPPVEPRCVLHPARTDMEWVEKWKADQGVVDGRYVLFHAGSSPGWLSKRWPANSFGELSLLFEQIGLQCIWVGDKEDEGLNHDLASRSGMDATGKFNIMQLYLLGRQARFAVTNDSGPMHILAAAGVPVFAFFGPTDWARHHAFGQKKRAIFRPVDCGPCYKKVCPVKIGHICLDAISSKTVFRQIQLELGL